MNKTKRKYKKFTTSLDERIIKEMKTEAIEREMSVAQLLEMIWEERKENFMQSHT